MDTWNSNMYTIQVNNTILLESKDKWTDGQMDGWKERQIDRWTDGQTDINKLRLIATCTHT